MNRENISALLDSQRIEGPVRVAGHIICLETKWTNAGHAWATFTLADDSDMITVCVFPKYYAVFGDLLADGRHVEVIGLLNSSRTGLSVFADSMAVTL